MPTPRTKSKALSPEEAAGAANGWTPEPGDNITGTVMAIEEIESDYGSYPMLTLDTGEGSDPRYVNLHAFHQVLLTGLKRIKPGPGAQISVTYHGKQDTKKKDKDGTPRQFHNYTVRDPAKPATAFTWGDETDADF